MRGSKAQAPGAAWTWLLGRLPQPHEVGCAPWGAGQGLLPRDADATSGLPHAHWWVPLAPQTYFPIVFYSVRVMGKSHQGAGNGLSYGKVLEPGELNVHSVLKCSSGISWLFSLSLALSSTPQTLVLGCGFC